MTPYRFLPHTADIAVELRARSEMGLYQSAVDALRALLVGKSPVAPAEERPVPRRGADPTASLIHFLGDVLYLYDTTRFLPARVSPAGIRGEPLDPRKHTVEREVKAVTHHGALLAVDDAGYRVTIIFDV